jgi:hypothetical protein
LLLAAIAALQALALIGYAAFDIVEAVRVGITGPVEVSNPMALVGLIVITAAFGVGMLVVAKGWWSAQRWARAPFVLAQLILGLIGWELSQATGSAERTVGFACLAIAVIGLVLAFLPSVTRVIDDEP